MRKFVVYHNSEHSSVPQGGCVELQINGSFKAWLAEHVQIEDGESLESALSEWLDSYDDDEFYYKLVPLGMLEDEYKRLDSETSPQSWRLAAREIAKLAANDGEVKAAFETSDAGRS